MARPVLYPTDREASRAPAEACRKLWLAVLEHVAADLRTRAPVWVAPGRPVPPDRERDWLTSDSRAVGAFLWVCEHLGLEPDPIRRELLRSALDARTRRAPSVAPDARSSPR